MTASQTQLEKAAVSSVFDEMSSELSRTYAEALVNVAEKSEQAEEILEELDAIRAFDHVRVSQHVMRSNHEA